MATARAIAVRVVVLLVFEARARVARVATQQPSPSTMALKMACRTRCSVRLKTPRGRAGMAVHPSVRGRPDTCPEGHPSGVSRDAAAGFNAFWTPAASLRAACEPAPLARPQARPVSGAVRYAALRSASALSAQVGRRACQAL